MKSQTASELQLANSMVVETESLLNRMEEIHQEIARRAYELFEERGREEGRDHEDWLRAESELLTPIPVEMIETTSQLRLSIGVDGFSEKELELSVEPRRLFISGKKEEARDADAEAEKEAEYRSTMFFRALDLPVPVDAEKAKASLKDGSLTIILPKAAEVEGPKDNPAE
jgi:HSP20 family protein